MVRKDAWNDFDFFEAILIYYKLHDDTALLALLLSLLGVIDVLLQNTMPETVDGVMVTGSGDVFVFLTDDINSELDLIDIYRTFHPKTMNFTFFSSAHGTFSRIDHILGHKSTLGKF